MDLRRTKAGYTIIPSLKMEQKTFAAYSNHEKQCSQCLHMQLSSQTRSQCLSRTQLFLHLCWTKIPLCIKLSPVGGTMEYVYNVQGDELSRNQGAFLSPVERTCWLFVLQGADTSHSETLLHTTAAEYCKISQDETATSKYCLNM